MEDGNIQIKAAALAGPKVAETTEAAGPEVAGATALAGLEVAETTETTGPKVAETTEATEATVAGKKSVGEASGLKGVAEMASAEAGEPTSQEVTERTEDGEPTLQEATDRTEAGEPTSQEVTERTEAGEPTLQEATDRTEAGETASQEVAERARRRKFILEKLDEWGIPYFIHEHPPIPTIEEALEYWKNFEGCTHCKNLFFRNHKGNRHYLVVLECHKQMDIHALEHELHQGKLSFASPQRMARCLDTTPGSVSLLGLANDPEHQVKLFLDKDLRQSQKVTFHPNDNTASLEISTQDMYRFLDLWGGEWEEI